MKVLCDVHISFRVVAFFNSAGMEAVHVNNILDGYTSKDADIASFADRNGFVVFTKDADFRDAYLLKQSPKRLIKVNLGNVSTKMLIQLVQSNLEKIRTIAEKESFMIEIETSGLRLTSF